jgi:hypothetical protein
VTEGEVREFQRTIWSWRESPRRFILDNFHRKDQPLEELDDWQEQFLAALPDQKLQRLALQGPKGGGKTWAEAMAIWWFLSVFGEKGNHPSGLACSNSGENLRDALWTELSKWHQRSPFLQEFFTWRPERVFAKAHPWDWYMSARAYTRNADRARQAQTLAGKHADYVLFVIDESGDVRPTVLIAADAVLAKCKWGKIVQGGNPLDLDSALHVAAVDQRAQYEVIRIHGDPDDPKRSKKISEKWAREQIATWGRDNPWVIVNVFGEFPPGGINQLLSADEVHNAMERVLVETDYNFVQKRLGVDVARFGDDKTVLFLRQGRRALMPVRMRNARSHEIADRIALEKATWRGEMEFVDVTGGLGAGVVDALLLRGITAIPVDFSGRADDPRFFNKRSEIWWRMAEWVKTGGWLPKDPELVRQLIEPTYGFQGGKFRLEEKEQFKKRLGYSPDEGDALATTFALVDLPTDSTVGGLAAGGGGGPVQNDTNYSPYRRKR